MTGPFKSGHFLAFIAAVSLPNRIALKATESVFPTFNCSKINHDIYFMQLIKRLKCTYSIFWIPNNHIQSWKHWFENSNEDDAIYEHSKSWTHILEFFAVSLISSKVIKGFVFSRRSQNYWLTGLCIVNDGPRRMDDGHLRLKRNFQEGVPIG